MESFDVALEIGSNPHALTQLVQSGFPLQQVLTQSAIIDGLEEGVGLMESGH